MKEICLNNLNYETYIGKGNFIKTISDIQKMITKEFPSKKYSIAYSEASTNKIIVVESNYLEYREESIRILKIINSGHYFVIICDIYPVYLLPKLKKISGIVKIEIATGNPISLLKHEGVRGDFILAFTDGYRPENGVESENQKKERNKFIGSLV